MLETIRNLGRVTELAMVLVRHGFADLVDRLGLPSAKGTGARSGGDQLARRYSVYARLRMVAEQMGPTFVKLGQILSQRPDLLPKQFILEFSKLRDQVTPLPFADIRTQVERALERPLGEVFSRFETTCLASASLAQVHRAVRSDDGREVAVKVRKPGIVRTIEADMELLGVLARLADKELEAAAPYGLPELVKEMDRSLRQELDFSLEARHMRTAKAQLAPGSEVLIPQPHLDLTRPEVLTMDLVEGEPIDQAVFTPAEGKKLGQELVRLMMDEVLLKGFFHGDPHQGNILVTRTPQGRPRLAVLDWGLAGRLIDEDRFLLCDLLMATLNRDSKAVIKAWRDMGVAPRSQHDSSLERDVAELLEMVNSLEGEPMPTSKVILEMMEIMRQHHLKVPMQYALADKALLEMEGVARALNPEFRPVEEARPFVWRLYLERWRPDILAQRLLANLSDTLRLLQNLPQRLESLLNQTEKGELSLQFKHEGLAPLTRALQEGASRVTVGLIVAALIVGSSMIITTGVEPKLFGLPALGVVGYLISGIIGLWLVWSVFRSRGGRF